MQESKDTSRYFFGMVLAMLLWGVAWTAGKVAAQHSNAEVAAFWRYGISFLTIIPVVLYLKIPLKTDKMGFIYMLGAEFLRHFLTIFFLRGLLMVKRGMAERWLQHLLLLLPI